jgi:hypothetical protein
MHGYTVGTKKNTAGQEADTTCQLEEAMGLVSCSNHRVAKHRI